MSVSFEVYLENTVKTAETEKELLNILSEHLRAEGELSKIEMRVQRSRIEIFSV
jgi:hypothetical protein